MSPLNWNVLARSDKEQKVSSSIYFEDFPCPLSRFCTYVDETPSENVFLKDYLSKSKPVVIRNAVKHWQAMTKWTNNFFRERFGTESVHVKLVPPVGIFEGVESKELWTGKEVVC